MSYSGSFTPLALNLISGLSNDNGFNINPVGAQYHGSWTPTSYSPGSLITASVLGQLTSTTKLIYDAVQSGTTDVTVDTYRNLISIGAVTIPALANTKPSTFVPTYAGNGNWSAGMLVSDAYPPKNYPVDGSWSYIHQSFSDYAWVTGWPGRNSWQKSTDSYKAAYLPVLGEPLNDYDEYFSNGFLSTIARQAYYEIWTDQFVQYNAIVNTFQQSDSWKNLRNSSIASFVNTKTFMTGMYSNVNDLTTSDIAGVSLAFKVWGTDLINSGRSIDLSNISKFGLPSILLKTLQRNNVLTNAVKIALNFYSNLSVTEINSILNDGLIPTSEQESKIYNAFTLVQGDDLKSDSTGILYGLNCVTTGIQSLADLLDLKKLFPNSYSSLTIPQYSTTTASAKIYDFIYLGNGVNDRIADWGNYLNGILSPALAKSCGAFSMTMRQIKNIEVMHVERFSQVVSNLELTGLNLPLVNSTGVPGNVDAANSMLDKLALGSGNSGSFRQCDFYGAASGYPYDEYYKHVAKLISEISSGTLSNIYNNLSLVDLTVPGADLTVQGFIDAANTEISNIYNKNKSQADNLNYFWNLIGSQLSIEQRAITLAISNTNDILEQVNTTDIPSFVQQVETYATDTTQGGNAPTLERLSNTNLLSGQSLIAMMRETRNASRIQLTGGDLQNDVSTVIDICGASASATVLNGTISSIKITSHSSGYNAATPPKVTVYPVGHGAILKPFIAPDGSISSIEIVAGGNDFVHAEIEIEPPPQCAPPETQRTYADSSSRGLVPTNLISSVDSSPTVQQAMIDIEQCNCSCWN